MREIKKMSKAEKILLKLEMIEHSVNIISTDLYLDGKLNNDAKWLIENDLKGINLIKKNKGYIYG